jgi:hypothetical protein
MHRQERLGRIGLVVAYACDRAAPNGRGPRRAACSGAVRALRGLLRRSAGAEWCWSLQTPPNGGAAGTLEECKAALKRRYARIRGPMDHGDDEVHEQPHFDLAAIRRGVAAGMMSPAQAVWYLR